MKVTTTIVALTVALAPVYSYQISPLLNDGSLMKRQVLFRRSPMSGQPHGRYNGRHVTSTRLLDPDNRAIHGQGSTSQITPPGRDQTRRPQVNHGQPRPDHSDGDSDSSVEGGQKSKVKATGTGPASISWQSWDQDKRMHFREVKQNEKFKQSVRGGDTNGMAEMGIITHYGNPAGKAKMTIRGQGGIDAKVSARFGGHGTHQDLRPEHNDQPTPVPSETHDVVRIHPSRRFSTPRLKTTMQGHGRLDGEALD